MNPTDLVQGALHPAAGGVSMVELFMQAHPLVKGVMIGLLLASIWAWAIIFQKWFRLRFASRQSSRRLRASSESSKRSSAARRTGHTSTKRPLARSGDR